MSIKSTIDLILKNEGGFVDHENDRGGATNFGITARTYSSFLGVDVDYVHLTQMIKMMPVDTARMIYKENYFYKPKINQLPELIQGQMMDMAVNHGPKRAYKLLQRSLNYCNNCNLAIDGLFGKKSWIELDTLGVTDRNYKGLSNELVNSRVEFYEAIIKNDPSQEVFFKGWIKRAEKFRP